jgi:Domain of unknown function (DUF4149)
MKATLQSTDILQSPPDRLLLGGLLCAWMGAIVLLDLVVMPGLYFTGMMQQADFAGAGYSIFGAFSHLEMLVSAVVLTLVLWRIKVTHDAGPQSSESSGRLWLLASMLLMVCCLVSSVLVPQMSALSMPLDGGFDRVLRDPDETMNWFHGLYWMLDCLKIFAAGLLVWML